MIALRGLHTELRPYAEYALQIAKANGLTPQVTSVYRGLTQQQRLRTNWEQCQARGLYPSSASLGYGLSCAYPANRPGDSGHNFGLAWDSWVPETDMPTWRAIREWIGWTVPEHDQIHAELPQWRLYVPNIGQ